MPSVAACALSFASSGPSPTIARRQPGRLRRSFRPGAEQDIETLLLDQAPDGDDGRRVKGCDLRIRMRQQGIGQKGELLARHEGPKRLQRAFGVRRDDIGPRIDESAATARRAGGDAAARGSLRSEMTVRVSSPRVATTVRILVCVRKESTASGSMPRSVRLIQAEMRTSS